MTGRPDTIADRPEALTAEWLTAALTSSGVLHGAAVAGVTTSPLGTGQMCDSVRVTLAYDRETGAPATLVAKLPPADETSRATASALRNYEKEVRFYQSLAPTVAVRTPLVYYADIADPPDRLILLLEDLAPAQQGDQIAGCTPAVAEAALAQLVGLHAPRWGDPALEELDWLNGITRPGAGPQLAALWAGFADRYADRVTADIRTAGDQLFDHIEGFLSPTGGPRTVVHGDYRLDNLLIHPDTGSVTVVDWQTVALGYGPFDVAYLLGAGLKIHDRQEHEERLVRRYHEQLVRFGVTGFDWDECWAGYRRGAYSGLLMAVGASMMVRRTDRGDDMFLTMAERHARQILDLEAVTLIA